VADSGAEAVSTGQPSGDLRGRLQSALGRAYLIERELGGGGMSRVFVATETALNRSVVIKVITPGQAEGMSVERFAREVKLAARLQQANIVPVLAAGDADGLPYYTMPFVRGESLRARMATGEPVPIADAIHILRDIARALAYAHGEGIVHRDIKPENVLISGGAAVVADFGIAKAIDLSRTQDGDPRGDTSITLTQAGSTLGTPAYMAPEQAAGDPDADHRADIYAWGLIAWELLAGRHPFAGKGSLQAMVVAQMTEKPAPLASARPDAPAALCDVVARALEKDPARRPASAGEILAALDQAVSTGSSAASVPKGSRNNSRRVGGILAIAVIAIVAAGVWVLRGHAGAKATTGAGKSLAIIPFASSGNDTANAYLAEGIGDDVTNTLSQIPGLRLAGERSAASYAGKGATTQEIGRALQVSQVLEGTVRRDGDQVRVSVELSNTSDGQVVWRENYQHAANDVRAVQDELARAIAGQLQVTLANTGSAARGTSDPEAYDLYLKGMYLYRRRGPGITAAIADFEQATVRDSMFARAWAALSNALMVSPSYTPTRTGDVLPRGRAAAERAVRLDPTLSDAHLALGYVDAEAFDWPEAEAELKRAIALDPNAAEPRYRLGYTLMNQGRPAEAIPVLQRAVSCDPLYFMTAVYLGWAEAESGRPAEGLEEARRGTQMEPSSVTALSILAFAFVEAGFPDSAAFYSRRILAVSSGPVRIGVAASALARSGNVAEAQALVKRLVAMPEGAWTRWTGLVVAYSGLNDTTAMIDAMEHATAGDGDDFPTYAARLVGTFPKLPRVEAVLRRYNLDPARFEGKRQ
jgi:serine/threonine-protein kinase